MSKSSRRKNSLRKTLRKRRQTFTPVAERLEGRLMLAGDVVAGLTEGVLDTIHSPEAQYLNNPLNGSDTNGDGKLSPFDALAMMRGLTKAFQNSGKVSFTATEFMTAAGMGEGQRDSFFPDSTGNNKVDYVDVLKVTRDVGDAFAAEGAHGDLHARVEFRVFDFNPLDGALSGNDPSLQIPITRADVESQALDAITLGESVFLTVIVSDVSGSGTEGLGAAYLDVLLDTDHDANFVSVAAVPGARDVQIDQVFDFLQEGAFVGGTRNGNLVVDPSLLDEVGGVDIFPLPEAGPPVVVNELNGELSLLTAVQVTLNKADLDAMDDMVNVIQDSGPTNINVTVNDIDATFDVAGGPAVEADGHFFSTEDPTEELEQSPAPTDGSNIFGEVDFGVASIPILAFAQITQINGTPVNGAVATTRGSAQFDDGGTPGDFSDDSIEYTPGAGQVGQDTFTYTVTQAGQVSQATVTVNIGEFNDPPFVTAPDTDETPEETALPIDVSVGDPDAEDGDLVLTVTAQNGVVSLTNFTGTLNEINTALNGFTYTPELNFVGDANVVFTINDQGNTGVGDPDPQEAKHTTTVTVTPVNDAPMIFGSATQSTEENMLLNLTGYSITDDDIGGGDLAVELSVPVGKGTLSLSSTAGLFFSDAQGDDSMAFTGTIGSVNAALASLSYNPAMDLTEVVNLQIDVSDQGNTGPEIGMDDLTVMIDVFPSRRPAAINDPLTVAEKSQSDNPLNVVDVLDNDRPSPGFSLVFVDFMQPGSGNGVVTQEDAQNPHLLTYTPDPGFFGTDSFTYRVNDDNPDNQGIDTGTVNVTITPMNDAPTVVIAPRAPQGGEDMEIDFSAVVDDPDFEFTTDEPELVVTVQVNGSELNFAPTTADVDGAGTGSVTITGTEAEVNDALSAATYKGSLHFNGTDTLKITVNDQGNVGGGELEGMDSVVITVDAINDAPVVTAPGDVTGVKNVDVVLNGLDPIVVADPDDNVLTVLVTATHAQSSTPVDLTLGSTTGLSFSNPQGDESMEFTGTLNQINNAFASGLTVSPEQDLTGDVTITVEATDMDAEGGGSDPLTGDDSVVVNFLNFRPSFFEGYVGIDANGNGRFDNDHNNRIDDLDGNNVLDERAIGLAMVRLRGNSVTGFVDRTEFTDSEGHWRFDNIVPNTAGASYTIDLITTTTLWTGGFDVAGTAGDTDGSNSNRSFRINVPELGDVQGEDYLFLLAGLNPVQIGIEHFFASAQMISRHGGGLLMQTDASGNLTGYVNIGGWDNMQLSNNNDSYQAQNGNGPQRSGDFEDLDRILFGTDGSGNQVWGVNGPVANGITQIQAEGEAVGADDLEMLAADQGQSRYADAVDEVFANV